MKKSVFALLAALCCAACGFAATNDVVRLSSDEWKRIKLDMDSKGRSYVPSHGLTLIVTNGIPERMELPLGSDESPEPLNGGTGLQRRPVVPPRGEEPRPYQGQVTGTRRR